MQHIPGTVHASTQKTIQERGTGVCLARKTPCEQGLPHCTYVLQAELYYTIRVLVVRTPVSSLSFQVQHTWYLVRYLQAPKRLQIRGTGSVSRVKNPYEQGLPHYTYVLQAEQRLPHATEKAQRSFPMERGPAAKHHPAWNPQCTHWFRAEEFPLLPLPYTESHATLQSR